MKIAVTGKGGTGKTTLAAGLAALFVSEGKKVFAIDADPDANLALTLGYPSPSSIKPLTQMKELIEERTGAKIGSFNPYFKLNPRVDDIPDKYSVKHNGINLMLMGGVRGGGLGCACPENAFLKAMMSNLILRREEVIIMDMEAGIEHLGRATAKGVDELVVMVEPGLRSIETAYRVRELARQVGIENLGVVGNKIRNSADKTLVKEKLRGFNLLGFISFNQRIVEADLAKIPFSEIGEDFFREVKLVMNNIKEKQHGSR
jgi:CO dehydrogenase maturation factor